MLRRQIKRCIPGKQHRPAAFQWKQTPLQRAVLELVNNYLNVPLSDSDISIAHRIPAKGGSITGSRHPPTTSPPPIIVRFTTRRARDAVYRARKTLATSRLGVYINENLIQRRAKLFQAARDLLKKKKIQRAWTFNGMVFIKLSNLPTSPQIRVEKLEDMPSG